MKSKETWVWKEREIVSTEIEQNLNSVGGGRELCKIIRYCKILENTRKYMEKSIFMVLHSKTYLLILL